MAAAHIRSARLWSAAVLVGVFLIAIPHSASAHSQIIDSSPAPGQELTVPPESIILTFSEEISELGAAIVLADSDENLWTAEDIAFDGPVVSTDIESELDAGSYQIRWRVVSADGHPIDGTIDFSVTAAEPVTPLETQSPTEAPTPESTPADDAGETTPSSAEAADNEPAGNSSTIVTALVVVAVAALAVAAFLVYRRRANGGQDEDL